MLNSFALRASKLVKKVSQFKFVCRSGNFTIKPWFEKIDLNLDLIFNSDLFGIKFCQSILIIFLFYFIFFVVDNLEEIQKRMIKLKNKEIFEENSINEGKTEEIDLKCQEISCLFNRLHSLVNEMRNVPKVEGSRKRLLANVLQWEYQVITDLSIKFRDVEQVYLNKIREYDDYMIKFDETSDSSSNFIQDFLADNTFGFDNRPMQMQKVKEYTLSDAKYLKDKEREMNSILGSIGELNQIFQDINTAVISQGSLLDRIDYNMENVEMNVARGNLELSSAAKRVRRSRKIKLIFLIALSILLLLIVITIRS